MGFPWPLIPGNNLDDVADVGQSLQNLTFGSVEHGPLGSTETIDFSVAHSHSGILDANVTLTFVAPLKPGICQLFLTEDVTGGHTVTKPGDAIWVQGSPPPTMGPSQTRIFDIRYDGAAHYIWYSPASGDAFLTIVTSSGTTGLTSSSPSFVLLTGTATHQVYLPDPATIYPGFTEEFLNTSTLPVLIRSFSGTLLATILAGGALKLTYSGSAWVLNYSLGSYQLSISANVLSTVLRDSNANASANNWISGLAEVATAGGTTTLTVASKRIQRFTGTQTQNCVLPDVTTLPQVGYAQLLINDSTGAVTVKSSGGNDIAVLAGGTRAWLICRALTGTDASSWTYVYAGAVPLVHTVASSATPTPDFNYSELNITALAVDATFASPTGPLANGKPFVVRVKDNGSPRALAFNAIYRPVGVDAPLTTVAGKVLYLGMKYNAADNKVDILAVGQEV